MTILMTIQEEPYIAEATSLSQTYPSNYTLASKLPRPLSEAVRHSSADSLTPVREKLEMEGSGSDWGDDTSWASVELHKEDSNKTFHDEQIAANPQLLNPSRLHHNYQLKTPQSPKSSSLLCHQSFLERLARILCNHSAAVDTSDDTSVIVEISSLSNRPAMVATNGKSHGPRDNDQYTNMTLEERKREALRRSQEEYLLNVITAQKEQLNNLW